jgi:hypothetical protein
MKEKIDLASQMQENSLFPTDWIYHNLFHLSENEFDDIRDQILEDKKREFRFKQVAEEGNDPAESGEAFGTPHQIASLYGGNSNYTAATAVPQGYDELDPNEKKKVPGRPTEKPSFINTPEDPLGRDRMGTYDIKSKPIGGEEGGLRHNFAGGSALALENSKAQTVFHQNKGLFESLEKRKIKLFEQSSLLDEDNIKEDL